MAALLFGAEAATAQTGDGAQLFAAHCAMCHLDPHAPGDSTKIGPPLGGIVGRKAAADPDYTRYSAALRRSGMVWSEASLAAYLAAPTQAVPGTTMALVGMTSPAERTAIINYLKSAPKR
ncbi:c-type cytochrome [Polymorphobacter arshaanensis]|uniref:C-type cytochrome n=2 Tax=Glacieibacterium arshaanense TaxID=2511025 RepID=A0A4Y9ESU3_9SPHN|nr:c-type cytochrome [Polymorphobacter arshaanensis]